MGDGSFIAESFGGRDGYGVAGWQQAGEECADSEEGGGCEQTSRGKGVLHPVGENRAKKAVHGEAQDHARGRADQRDARGDPQHMHPRRAQRPAHAELRSALRDAVSDDAEDADQREPERHGREDAKQYGEEPLAAVLCVVLNGFVQGEGAVGDLLVGSDGCDRGADGVQVGERIALSADEELHVLPHQGGVRKVDGGNDGAIDTVVARIADDADDLTPGGALRRTGREAILKGESGNA